MPGGALSPRSRRGMLRPLVSAPPAAPGRDAPPAKIRLPRAAVLCHGPSAPPAPFSWLSRSSRDLLRFPGCKAKKWARSGRLHSLRAASASPARWSGASRRCAQLVPLLAGTAGFGLTPRGAAPSVELRLSSFVSSPRTFRVRWGLWCCRDRDVRSVSWAALLVLCPAVGARRAERQRCTGSVM